MSKGNILTLLPLLEYFLTNKSLPPDEKVKKVYDDFNSYYYYENMPNYDPTAD